MVMLSVIEYSIAPTQKQCLPQASHMFVDMSCTRGCVRGYVVYTRLTTQTQSTNELRDDEYTVHCIHAKHALYDPQPKYVTHANLR